MFFNKKKPKIDSKIKFQNRQFNQKLQAARTFKRTAKPISESEFDRFLERVGLGSRWTQALVLLIILGAVYIVYSPNFLSVQSIKVEGLPDEEKALVESAIQDSLNSRPFYDPQHNLLFLSKKRVNLAALSIAGIDSVEKITKNFKSKILYVTVKPKHERFLVRTSEKIFDVYNDGTLKGEAGLNRDAWQSTQNPGMAKVELTAKVTEQNTRQFFTTETVKYLIQLQESLKGITGSSLAYFSVRIPQLKEQQDLIDKARQLEEEAKAPLTERLKDKAAQDPPSEIPANPTTTASPQAEVVQSETAQNNSEISKLPAIEINLPVNTAEIDIVFQKGNSYNRTFKVIVDAKEDPEQLVQRLNLLLSQTTPDRYSQLSYIDLRIQSRAFVCLLNTVCNR